MPEAAGGIIIRPMRDEDVPAGRAIMFRTVEEDFGDSYDPVAHSDIDFMEETYLHPATPGPFMLVAEDDETGEVIATCGIRAGALKEGLSPEHLVARYRDGRAGQLVRVYVLKEHRRRGIAAQLVQAVLERAAVEGHYDKVALHTFPHSPGAHPFWLSQGAVLVEDDTKGITRALFFEIPFVSKAAVPA